MFVRLGRMWVAALGAIALLAPAAVAEAPGGPRLSFVRASDRKLELVTTDPAGSNPQVIAGGGEASVPLPYIFSAPSWSADGTKVAFVGMSRLGSEARTDIYLAAADGSGLVKVPGTGETLEAVLSPDGGSVAFSRERKGRLGRTRVVSGTSVWLALGGGKPRELVSWHGGVFSSPSSFSPDGSTLALSQNGHRRTMAVALSLVGKGRKIIARNAAEPIYSPDGSRVALLTAGRVRTLKDKEGGTTTFTPTELAVANADGSALRRLTRTPFTVELLPSWDPSGARLAYSQVRVDGGESDFLGIGKPLMQINADGTCRQAILSIRRTILFGATWQPGPGREAGPISC